MKLLAIVLIILGVTGCAPRLLSQTEDSISFTVKTGLLSNNVDEATASAQAHCAKRGKKARLESLNNAGSRSIALFHCV